MLKRTKGRLLITLLVITGLAGNVKHTSLLPQERKFAVSMWKDNRNKVLNSIQNLSDKQFQFQSSQTNHSIAFYVDQINASERIGWELFEKAMSEHATIPEMRLTLNYSDQEIIDKVKAEQSLAPFVGNISTSDLQDKNATSSINTFKAQRTLHIRYLRSSTEDLRNHILQTSSGSIDCYQLALAIASYHQILAEKIELIKNDPSFPGQ